MLSFNFTSSAHFKSHMVQYGTKLREALVSDQKLPHLPAFSDSGEWSTRPVQGHQTEDRRQVHQTLRHAIRAFDPRRPNTIPLATGVLKSHSNDGRQISGFEITSNDENPKIKLLVDDYGGTFFSGSLVNPDGSGFYRRVYALGHDNSVLFGINIPSQPAFSAALLHVAKETKVSIDTPTSVTTSILASAQLFSQTGVEIAGQLLSGPNLFTSNIEKDFSDFEGLKSLIEENRHEWEAEDRPNEVHVWVRLGNGLSIRLYRRPSRDDLEISAIQKFADGEDLGDMPTILIGLKNYIAR